jgi:predicted phage terminase large subunit-like protein
MTGKRGDRVIWDDPHSVEGAFSNADRVTTLRVFTETIPTRLNNPDKSVIVVVMQRLHEVDVAGYIIANDLGYVTLILPMEYESNRKCSTAIGFTDPRTTDGELLFPDRFPQWVVDRDKKIMGSYAVAGQFQQRPSPRGGGIIKGGSFGRYVRAPVILFRKVFADTAQKTGQRNDYSVFEEYGLGDDNKLYLLSMIRGKWEAPELKRQCIDFWNKCNARINMGALREMGVEDKASGTGLIQDIQRDGKIPVVAIQRNKDKLTRVMDVVSYIEAGYVMIPEDAPFASDFISECEAFTADDSHLHDDQIDPLLDAINDMLANRNPDYMPSVRVI